MRSGKCGVFYGLSCETKAFGLQNRAFIETPLINQNLLLLPFTFYRKEMTSLSSPPPDQQGAQVDRPRRTSAQARINRTVGQFARRFVQTNLPPLRVLPSEEEHRKLAKRRTSQLTAPLIKKPVVSARLSPHFTCTILTPNFTPAIYFCFPCSLPRTSYFHKPRQRLNVVILIDGMNVIWSVLTFSQNHKINLYCGALSELSHLARICLTIFYNIVSFWVVS